MRVAVYEANVIRHGDIKRERQNGVSQFKGVAADVEKYSARGPCQGDFIYTRRALVNIYVYSIRTTTTSIISCSRALLTKMDIRATKELIWEIG